MIVNKILLTQNQFSKFIKASLTCSVIFISTILLTQESLAQNSLHAPSANLTKSIDDAIPWTEYAFEYVDIINAYQMTFKSSFNLSTNQVADTCSDLMNKNQIQGYVGEYITQVFKAHSTNLSHLIQGGRLNAICPQYSQMDIEKKSLLWTLILASVAHFESSCNTKAINPNGPNGTAYGYYQLHKNKEHFYDEDNSGLCVKNASADPRLASKCALSMLEKQFKNDNGLLFSPKSYWEVLRPRGRSQKASLIRTAIINSSLCKKFVM